VTDDRPALDPVEALAALQRRVDDLETTTAARMLRRPTGTVEAWIWPNPLPGTLLLQGQTLSRATYPDLWRVVQERGGVTSGVFGAGDGSTTFVLPDLRGRALVGADAANPLGTKFGAESVSVTLTTANMPAHNHTINGSGTHGHSGTTSSDGTHGGHWDGGANNIGYHACGECASYINPSQDLTGNFGSHFHGFGTSQSGDHNHGGGTGNAGASTPVALSVVQPSFAGHWLIWV
jgi:microcystin-dependent protein